MRNSKDCSVCPIIDNYRELLKLLEPHIPIAGNLLDKLPKCNCVEEEKKAAEHHRSSDVTYFWDCPLHGRHTEKFLEDLMSFGG